jgi:signal transduction histidine kinase
VCSSDLVDTGPGIPPDVLARIGEPFIQGRAAVEGAGLGLAISRALAERQGGSLVLESSEGSGTIATLRLPLPGQDASAGAGA